MLDKTDSRSLRSGFLLQASKRPDRAALVVSGVTRTYGELAHTARLWARGIHEVAFSRPERVGLYASRSEVSYSGAIAALLAGAAFVPLNPTFPPDKISEMIDRADLQVIIVDKGSAPQLPAVLGRNANPPPLLMPEFDSPHVEGVDVRVLDRGTLSKLSPLRKLPPLTPEDVAYLLFTSGSTGAPKGVPVTHGNVVYFMDVMTERYCIRPEDRFSQTFDQSFDLSVFDLFMAWSNGATVYSMATIDLLAPTKFINQNELTIWFSVPSLPAHMIRRNTLIPGSLPSLRWSLFCGEPLPRRTSEIWQTAAPNSVVENLYGPTELTISCFIHRWNPHTSPSLCENDLVPIGVPNPGLAALVVDESLEPVPLGEIGELLVSGPQTTPGYWRDHQKTDERYIHLPISGTEYRRFYRTGDRVRRLETGDYIFFGRTDHQLKVLGHRIELGEIESALRRNSAVEHAVACGWPVVDGSAEGIVGFVSGNSLDPAALINELKNRVPPYAVPKRIFVVSEMPLNSNGKVDRRALQERLAALENQQK
jgi:amino acid adenylation domain-containing protein